MDAGLIAGMVALVAAGAGLYVMLYAMGFFQYLGGKRRSSIPPVSKRELIDKILALNDPSKPYRIMKGVDSDFVAEWYGIFNKSGLKEAYRARLLVDEDRHAVRCYEELAAITWTAGPKGLTPIVHYERSFFRGRILYKKEYAKGYGIKQLRRFEAGKVYDYKFDINEIRGPIILTVKEWMGVGSSHREEACYLQAQRKPSSKYFLIAYVYVWPCSSEP